MRIAARLPELRHGGRASGWFAPVRHRVGLALLVGALPALAFPEPAWGWFAYVALVPWLLLLRSAPSGRQAAIEGWLGGMGFVIAVHHWLVPSLHVFIVVLGALLGLLWAPWGWLVHSRLSGGLSPSGTAAALVVVPSGWLMIELVRSWEGLGGPWGLLGASQFDVAPALVIASVGGVWLLTLLVVAVNTTIALLIAVPSARTAVLTSALVGALVITAMGFAAPRPEESGRIRVAIVQPGVFEGAGERGAEQRFARGEELTRALVGQRLDLVVWGESSVGADLGERPDLTARLTALSRAVGAEVLVNVDARRTDGGQGAGIYKSSVLVGPTGLTGDRYDKMRLVPFGEYVPARELLGWATSVGRAAGEDRVRGTRTVVMEVARGDTSVTTAEGGTRIGPLVCFESAFPDMSRQLTRDGARLLLAQSATSSFQGSWAPEQHASLAALRAAENGRPMVHATLTGVSAVYGAEGDRIGRQLPTDTSATAVYEVPLTRGTTGFVRFGDWAVQGAAAVLVVLGAWEAARRIRRRAPSPAVRPAHTTHGSARRPGR
ncbi:apolipoprotein N-acyltransferase [Streptomyces sp. NPDC059076]|uniref:apolipoprotein N-acyltransferase n=1 Tax=unclassified Streptomyces TaxID=2593676 RepID=UPI00368C6EC4